MSKLQIVSGSASKSLAQKVANKLGMKLTPTKKSTFADGETYVKIKEKVRGDDVFVIQSVCPPINDNLIELLITIDALKRASAQRINVVTPYLGYSRQDRKITSREPITSKLVADLITKAGADRIFSIDLHQGQIQGFYDIPVDHFVGYPIFTEHFVDQGLEDPVIVAPDVGAVDKARKMATLIKCPIAIIDKRRSAHNKAEILNIVGKVKGKTAILLDDMVDTGGTITSAAGVINKKGASEVKICATHPLLSKNASKRIENSPASEALFLDTIPIPKEKQNSKIKQLSMSGTLSRAIKRIHESKSLGKLFTWEDKVRKL